MFPSSVPAVISSRSCPTGDAPPLPGPPLATPPPCLPWQQLAGATAGLRCPNTAPSCCERRTCPRQRRCTTRTPTRCRSPPTSRPAVSPSSGHVTAPPAQDSVNAPPCPPAGSYYASALHPPHKPCMAQFLRSSNVPESSLPPSASTPSSFPGDPQTAHPHASSSPGYPPRDRMGPPSFHAHPGQPQYGPLVAAHGVYAPLYDSRRVWRPQVSPRPTGWQERLIGRELTASLVFAAVSQRGRQEQLAASGGAALLRLPASAQGEVQLPGQQLLLRRAPLRPAQGRSTSRGIQVHLLVLGVSTGRNFRFPAPLVIPAVAL